MGKSTQSQPQPAMNSVAVVGIDDDTLRGMSISDPGLAGMSRAMAESPKSDNSQCAKTVLDAIQDEPISFCKHIACGCGYGKRNVSIDQWAKYLDDQSNSCLYYKFKLAWTWLYLMFCCCHCMFCGLNMNAKGVKARRKKKRMDKLFQAAEKIMTQKFNSVPLRVSSNGNNTTTNPNLNSNTSNSLQTPHRKVARSTQSMITPPITPETPTEDIVLPSFAQLVTSNSI